MQMNSGNKRQTGELRSKLPWRSLSGAPRVRLIRISSLRYPLPDQHRCLHPIANPHPHPHSDSRPGFARTLPAHPQSYPAACTLSMTLHPACVMCESSSPLPSFESHTNLPCLCPCPTLSPPLPSPPRPQHPTLPCLSPPFPNPTLPCPTTPCLFMPHPCPTQTQPTLPRHIHPTHHPTRRHLLHGPAPPFPTSDFHEPAALSAQQQFGRGGAGAHVPVGQRRSARAPLPAARERHVDADLTPETAAPPPELRRHCNRTKITGK